MIILNFVKAGMFGVSFGFRVAAACWYCDDRTIVASYDRTVAVAVCLLNVSLPVSPLSHSVRWKQGFSLMCAGAENSEHKE